VKLQWTHAELLTALAAPARRATDGVARVLGLRAEGAEDNIGSESDPPLSTPPLRPDPAWAKAARALARPGWAAPRDVRRHEPLNDVSVGANANPAAATNPGVSAALRRAAEPPDAFEPLGGDTASPPPPMSASLGFEPLNHPLLREAPRAERAAYALGAAPARAPWTTSEPPPIDGQAPEAPPAQTPASLEFEPSTTPESLPIPRGPASLEFEPSLRADLPAQTAAALAPPERPPASLEFEPSVTPDRPAHTAATLSPPAQAVEPDPTSDLERLGDAFSDPFEAFRPGGAASAPTFTGPADDAPLPAHTTRLPLHPAPRHEPPPPSTMELQGAEAPRPLRLRDLGRAGAAARAAPAAPTAPTAAAPAARAPLDELFDDTPPEFEALPEGPAFSSVRAVPPRRAAPPPAPTAAPSPARLRPAVRGL
jgi:hypothetical protein